MAKTATIMAKNTDDVATAKIHQRFTDRLQIGFQLHDGEVETFREIFKSVVKRAKVPPPTIAILRELVGRNMPYYTSVEERALWKAMPKYHEAERPRPGRQAKWPAMPTENS